MLKDKRWGHVGVTALAVAAVVAIAVLTSSGRENSPEELAQARENVAVSQILAVRRSAQQHAVYQDKKEVAKARMAMRSLESNLESELGSVKAVLGKLDTRRMALHEEQSPPKSAKKTDEQAAWNKRTMQRGAMRGESTQKQLTRVLKKELSDAIHTKLKWSKQGLKKAADFAEYLRAHPLPDLDDNKAPKKVASLQEDVESGDGVSATQEKDGIVKVTFKREMTMTEEQYRELEDALRDSEKKRSAGSGEADQSTENSAILRRYAEEGRDERRAEQERGQRPLADSEREAEKVLNWKPVRAPQVSRMPEASAVRARSEGEEVKDILEKILGVQGTVAASSAAPRTSSLKQQPSPHGRKWAAQEEEREHSEFAKLPPRHKEIAQAVQPYYWLTVPARKRARISREHP